MSLKLEEVDLLNGEDKTQNERTAIGNINANWWSIEVIVAIVICDRVFWITSFQTSYKIITAFLMPLLRCLGLHLCILMTPIGHRPSSHHVKPCLMFSVAIETHNCPKIRYHRTKPLRKWRNTNSNQECKSMNFNLNLQTLHDYTCSLKTVKGQRTRHTDPRPMWRIKYWRSIKVISTQDPFWPFANLWNTPQCSKRKNIYCERHNVFVFLASSQCLF